MPFIKNIYIYIYIYNNNLRRYAMDIFRGMDANGSGAVDYREIKAGALSIHISLVAYSLKDLRLN